MLPVAVRRVTFLAVLLAASISHADPPYDPAIDVQLFDYAIGPRSFLTVMDADGAERGALSADVLFTFLTDPFIVYDFDEMSGQVAGARTDVVHSMVAGQLVSAYGLSDSLQLGISFPFVVSMSGQGLDPPSASMSPEGLQISGLGDLRFEAKYRLWQAEGLHLAGVGAVTVPTSFGVGGSDFLGDDLPSLRGHLAAQWTDSRQALSLGANLGFIARKPREIYASRFGHQLAYGGAAAYRLTDQTSIVAELFGRADLPNLRAAASTLELGGGLRVQVTQSISVLAGGGVGLVAGIGSPGLRAFAAIGWAPDYGDSDGDGVSNMHDKCPLIPEDRDGFSDLDGCPDNDNDGDMREDDVDKCPNDKEDLDGFEDEDGCPDLDNDADGINDFDDKCPDGREDGSPPRPDDGCPLSMTDSDVDDIADSDDACPEQAEDLDGFEDWDGCPEPDNDRDGILDDDDQCPVCAEDADGIDDEDGCPEIERIARLEGDRIVIDEEITFTKYDRIPRTSLGVVDVVAEVMLDHLEVTKWMIIVALPRQGSEAKTKVKADKRASDLKDHLVARGVLAEIEVVGAVADSSKIGIVARDFDQDAESPGFVCPADFAVVPRTPDDQP